MSGLRSSWPHAGYVSRQRDCEGCGDPLPVQPHQGNPRKWCSESCRVRTYRMRLRIEEARMAAEGMEVKRG